MIRYRLQWNSQTFKGNGTRKVNIEGDSYGAIIQDTMKYVF